MVIFVHTKMRNFKAVMKKIIKIVVILYVFKISYFFRKHFENTPMQYTEIFKAAKLKKKSYFCSKNIRWWVHIRTASPRQF